MYLGTPTHEERLMNTQSTRCSGFITDLVQRCAARDEAALGSLFDLFAPIVIGAVGGPPSRERDALVVEAFHRVWARAPTYDPASRNVVEWILEQVRDLPGEYLAAS